MTLHALMSSWDLSGRSGTRNYLCSSEPPSISKDMNCTHVNGIGRPHPYMITHRVKWEHLCRPVLVWRLALQVHRILFVDMRKVVLKLYMRQK